MTTHGDDNSDKNNGRNSNSFLVDLHGVVELLSNHLYSGPQVFIRELLQNAVDATTVAAESGLLDGSSGDHLVGEIRFRLFAVDGRPAMAVTDNGIGLTETEAVDFMSVIGRSSKRDEIGMARESLIGQFGVGILSCFTVSEHITVETRSGRGGEPIRWTGRADGTWSVEPGGDRPVGSTVTLVARPGEEQFFTPEFVAKHLRLYGELLPHRVWLDLDGETPQLISRDITPLLDPNADPSDTVGIGRDLLGVEPLDFFPIESAMGQTRGVAYVLPHEVRMTSDRGDRVYVKGMLVSPSTDRVLPPWAFFVRCVLLSDGLHPTASREELHEDQALFDTRDELGASIKAGLADLAGDHERLSRLVSVHHQAMKALAVDDPDFLTMVADWLPMQTSAGAMTLGAFARAFPVATYTRTVDEFRQLSPIAAAQGIGLICGGFTHDFDLVVAATRAIDSFTADEVKTEDLFGGFGTLSGAETERAAPLKTISEPWFDRLGIEVLVRRFEPLETPALLAVDDNTLRSRTISRAREESNPLFAAVLDSIDPHEGSGRPVLCLNIGNPTVERLIGLAADVTAGGSSGSDEPQTDLLRRALEVLYLQAMLMGHHPLSMEESILLNTSLGGLLDHATRPPTGDDPS